MMVSVHQPAYMPWLGYFDKIVRSDIFVFLDSVQYQKNSFQNRNRILGPQGPFWLTVPVKSKGHIGTILRNTLIDDTRPWRDKHLKSIEMNYHKAPYFNECFPKLQALLATPEANLAELCWNHLQFWLTEFGIKTRIVRSSSVLLSSNKSDLILDLCKYFDANLYLSGALGRDYLNEASFASAGIKIQYQNFLHTVYPQLRDDFEPCIGIVDYWMNCGPASKGFAKWSAHGI